MTDPRIAKVIALLRTRGDLWPYPRGSFLRRRDAGFVGKLKKDCETCGASGKLKNGRDCAHCKGRGFTKVDRMEEPIKSGTSQKVDQGDPKCYHCEGRGVLPNETRCIWCRGSGRFERPPKPLDLDTLDAGPYDDFDWMQDALDRRVEQGSWEQLDHALERLESNDPRSYRLIELCYLTEPEDTVFGAVLRVEDLGDRDLLSLWRGLRFLEEQMPAQIKVPAYAIAFARRKGDSRGKGRHANPQVQGDRDREIRALRDAHPARWSYSKLAHRFGLTRQRIQQIVGDKEAA